MRITLNEAAWRLQSDVVAIPTETVYGLAASLFCPDAIEKIFLLKGRPRQNPLIIHLADPLDLSEWVEAIPADFESLKPLWPGPLTLVLPAKTDLIPPSVRANLPTAAFRVPAHPLTRALLALTGPLVVPSANLSGRPSSTTPEHVEADFGPSFPILDGGPSDKGLESTILAFHPPYWHILRQGALAAETFAPLLNYTPTLAPTDPLHPECPGQLFAHYAPKAKLLLSGPAEAILGFTERTYPLPCIPLGSLHDPAACAHALYHALRTLDTLGLTTVRLDLDFPTTGLWATIRERLLKAAASTSSSLSLNDH